MKDLCIMYNDSFLNEFILYLEKTDPSSWCTDVVKTEDGKNCLFGHLVDYFECEPDDRVSNIIDIFENLYASTYMIYPVNDGKNLNYKQDNPKDRCIAYLKNIMCGKEENTMQAFDRCYNEWKSRTEEN